MTRNFSRTRCLAAIAGGLLVLPLATAAAQTNDESRLTLGMSGGFIGSHVLWDVPNQPIFSTFDPPDLFHLRRETHSDITIGGHFTYYPRPHLGFVGEFIYVGLGTIDACNVTQDGGDEELMTACAALNGSYGSASIALVHGGLVYRPLSRSFLQPYIKGMVGVAFTPSSTVEMRSEYGAIADTALILTIYKDDSWKEMRVTWTAAFGIATAPSSGYQIFAEVRESWLPLGVVTAPTAGQGFVPPSQSAIKGYPSILVGFDIVLEKRRGRRY